MDFDNLPEPAGDDRPREFAPLPENTWLDVVIQACGLKDNRAGTGQYLAFEFLVESGPYAKRRIWGNVAHNHNIGRQQLKAIRAAVGEDAKTPDDLVNRRLQIKVKPETYNGKTQARPSEYGPPQAAEGDAEMPF
jgi:hypothetical protein